MRSSSLLAIFSAASTTSALALPAPLLGLNLGNLLGTKATQFNGGIPVIPVVVPNLGGAGSTPALESLLALTRINNQLLTLNTDITNLNSGSIQAGLNNPLPGNINLAPDLQNTIGNVLSGLNGAVVGGPNLGSPSALLTEYAIALAQIQRAAFTPEQLTAAIAQLQQIVASYGNITNSLSLPGTQNVLGTISNSGQLLASLQNILRGLTTTVSGLLNRVLGGATGGAGNVGGVGNLGGLGGLLGGLNLNNLGNVGGILGGLNLGTVAVPPLGGANTPINLIPTFQGASVQQFTTLIQSILQRAQSGSVAPVGGVNLQSTLDSLLAQLQDVLSRLRVSATVNGI